MGNFIEHKGGNEATHVCPINEDKRCTLVGANPPPF